MTFVKTEPGVSPIVVEATFPVPPSRVFEAWTNPDEVKTWFGVKPGSVEEATIDLTVGGRWCFVEAADNNGRVGFEGTYLEIVRDRRLVFSWTKFSEHVNGDRTVTPRSQVEIVFDETADGTHMRIIHSAVDPTSAGFAIGWESGVANLVAYFERPG